MREKNVKRAAHALFLSQGDDKNKILARYTTNKASKELVQDQGRALIILEKIVLPQGHDAYDEQEMFDLLMKKLKKKGHRIQTDEEEDTEQYAEEKRRYEEARRERVPSLFGVTVADVDAQKEAEKELDTPVSASPEPFTIGICPTCGCSSYHEVPKKRSFWRFWR